MVDKSLVLRLIAVVLDIGMSALIDQGYQVYSGFWGGCINNSENGSARSAIVYVISS